MGVVNREGAQIKKHARRLYYYLKDKSLKYRTDIINITTDEIRALTAYKGKPFVVLSCLIDIGLCMKAWHEERVREGKYRVCVVSKEDAGLNDIEKRIIAYAYKNPSGVRVFTLSKKLGMGYYDLLERIKILRDLGVLSLSAVRDKRLYSYVVSLTSEWRPMGYLF